MEAVVTDQEKIEKRAYERFEARGRQDGFALEDWILAEKDVIGQNGPTSTSKGRQSSKGNPATVRSMQQHRV